MKSIYKHSIVLAKQHRFYYNDKVMFVSIFRNSYAMKPSYCKMSEYNSYPREYTKYTWNIGYIDTDCIDLFEQRCMANDIGTECLYYVTCRSSEAADVNVADIDAVEQYAMDVYNGETADLDKATLRFSESV